MLAVLSYSTKANIVKLSHIVLLSLHLCTQPSKTNTIKEITIRWSKKVWKYWNFVWKPVDSFKERSLRKHMTSCLANRLHFTNFTSLWTNCKVHIVWIYFPQRKCFGLKPQKLRQVICTVSIYGRLPPIFLLFIFYFLF